MTGMPGAHHFWADHEMEPGAPVPIEAFYDEVYDGIDEGALEFDKSETVVMDGEYALKVMSVPLVTNGDTAPKYALVNAWCGGAWDEVNMVDLWHTGTAATMEGFVRECMDDAAMATRILDLICFYPDLMDEPLATVTYDQQTGMVTLEGLPADNEFWGHHGGSRCPSPLSPTSPLRTPCTWTKAAGMSPATSR